MSRPDSRRIDPEDVIVREIEIEDIAPVFSLGERVFRPDRWPTLYRTWDEYEVVTAFGSDGETCLVAEHDGRVVGFALGTMINKRRNAWIYGYLTWLAVDPDLTGSGIGKLLVTELRDLFIDLGARMVLVDTQADNDAAVSFFRHMGFGQEQEHVFMSLNLTQLPEYRRRRHRK